MSKLAVLAPVLALALITSSAPSLAHTVSACATQEAALRHARTHASKTRAKKALEKCKKANAPVVVTPANPYVDEVINVTIHPQSPLPEGYVYIYFVSASGGYHDDGFSHAVFKSSTSRSVYIGPTEDEFGGNEWENGKGNVIVSEGIPDNEASEKIIGYAFFRFIKKP
jgi:hypothetical protein